MTEDNDAHRETKHALLGRHFGHEDSFQIGVRWKGDTESPERRPIGYGWSMGELKITVAGVTVTASSRGDQSQSFVGWYLAPLFDWLATNWADLLHEEHSPWMPRANVPAAIAFRRGLDEWIAADDEQGRMTYDQVQNWYQRHGLRSIASGGLFPDLFIRRVADDIELSWSAGPPRFGPRGLTFDAATGYARLAVKDVAIPLWDAISWSTNNLPSLPTAADKAYVSTLCRKVGDIRNVDGARLAQSHLAEATYHKTRHSFAGTGHLDLFDGEQVAPDAPVPYTAHFSPAVAMFGGVSPDLDTEYIGTLRDALITSHGGQDCAELAELVSDRYGEPLRVPYLDGEEFAAALLEDLDLDDTEALVDIRAICRRLGIAVADAKFNTDSIRGAAIAGDAFSPRIVINHTRRLTTTNPAGALRSHTSSVTSSLTAPARVESPTPAAGGPTQASSSVPTRSLPTY